MNVTAVPFAVLRFQYRIARLPLQAIEDRVFARMDSEAPARLFFERSLGALDATIGNVLGDPRMKNRGVARVERSDALGRAARLDAAATQQQEHADADLKSKREAAAQDLKDAHARKDRELAAARNEAEERTRMAAEAAAKRTRAAEKQVDDVAARRRDAAETAGHRDTQRIRAAEQKATAAAEFKIDDAKAKNQEAQSKRAQADRVEKLADAEKQKRQDGRAAKS